MTGPRVAVLGAGILGSSTALFLARRGAEVTLVDAATKPMTGASRWNEGKIHLGFMYSADPTMTTAAKLVPGGLQFAPLLQDLIGDVDLPSQTTQSDDVYLCHATSVVSAGRMQRYLQDVLDLVRSAPGHDQYLCGLESRSIAPLTGAELQQFSGAGDVVAGFRVPERSVNTGWVADRFLEALDGEKHIRSLMNHRVLRVVRPDGSSGSSWSVATSSGLLDGFDFVVNALWESRLAIDLTVGLEPPPEWSNRYRVSVFLRTRKPVELASAVIAVGPFGDVKNYNGRDLYLSWYPAGLLATDRGCQSPVPPIPSQADKQRIYSNVLGELGARIPALAWLSDNVEKVTVAGGWVHAAADGSLSDPRASVHRRSDFGITRLGSYVSVDTGKYSTAPWLADRIARSICAGPLD